MSLFEFPHERLFYSWDRQTVSTFLADGDPQPNLEKLGAKKPNAPDKPPTLLASAAGRKMQLCHTQEGTWGQGTHEWLSTCIISAQLGKTFEREQAGFLWMAAIFLPTTSFKFHTDRRLFSYQFPFFSHQSAAWRQVTHSLWSASEKC